MKELFSLDGKLYKYCTFLCDILVLTLLWTVCSIPLITIGASTTAMYYVLTRLLSGREGYISKDFFKSFRQNFIQATFLTLLIFGAAWLIYFNIANLQKGSLLLGVQFVLCYELIIVIIYIFPVLSRFNMKSFQLIQTCIFMANRHLLTTITCFVLFISFIALCMYQPFLIVVAAGFYGWLTSLMFMKLFRKYLPKMDTSLEYTNAELGEMEDAQKADKTVDDTDMTNKEG
ncbi:MAG: YesL family protein [Firmicutes bacterium]|nr:YesL family protein [Bacillota bacterium]